MDDFIKTFQPLFVELSAKESELKMLTQNLAKIRTQAHDEEFHNALDDVLQVKGELTEVRALLTVEHTSMQRKHARIFQGYQKA